MKERAVKETVKEGRMEGRRRQSSKSDGKLSGRVQHSMITKPLIVGLPVCIMLTCSGA